MHEDVDPQDMSVVGIDAILIQDEYVSLPTYLTHWTARLAAVMEDFQRAEHDEEMTEARVYLESKVMCEKATVQELKALVTTNARVISARIRRIEAEAKKSKVRAMVDGIQAKKEMLISLGAHVRAELNASPSLRNQSAIARHER